MNYTKQALPSCNIGDYTYGTPRVAGLGEAELTIGKFCSIAEGVVIFVSGEHRTEWISTYPFSAAPEWEACPIHSKSKGNVAIGNDVWIGFEAVILSGVTIGDGACIGARSVVARDVAPYTIVAGNPARLIRKRFDDETIEALLQLKWWDWSFERIKSVVPILLSPNIKELLE